MESKALSVSKRTMTEKGSDEEVDTVRANIKRKFLIQMPDDFYQFWEFCNIMKPNDPLSKWICTCAYLFSVYISDSEPSHHALNGMRVVDMFNIICKLCGNFVSMFDTENLICWWLSKIQSSASFQTYIFIESLYSLREYIKRTWKTLFLYILSLFYNSFFIESRLYIYM